ncbi:MAG: hypothetical protein WBB65_04010 [Anaerolineales bacterium]
MDARGKIIGPGLMEDIKFVRAITGKVILDVLKDRTLVAAMRRLEE